MIIASNDFGGRKKIKKNTAGSSPGNFSHFNHQDEEQVYGLRDTILGDIYFATRLVNFSYF